MVSPRKKQLIHSEHPKSKLRADIESSGSVLNSSNTETATWIPCFVSLEGFLSLEALSGLETMLVLI